MFPRRCLLPILLLLGATACRERIQHGLDERQANELQTVLAGRGLDARKVPESGKKPTWAIEVADEQSSSAVRPNGSAHFDATIARPLVSTMLFTSA